MGRIDYREELLNEGEGACEACGSDRWVFDEERGGLSCEACGRELYDKPVKEKKVRLVMKMKYGGGDDS